MAVGAYIVRLIGGDLLFILLLVCIVMIGLSVHSLEILLVLSVSSL